MKKKPNDFHKKNKMTSCLEKKSTHNGKEKIMSVRQIVEEIRANMVDLVILKLVYLKNQGESNLKSIFYSP